MDNNVISGEFILNDKKKDVAQEKAAPEPEVASNANIPVQKNNPHFYTSFCHYPTNLTFEEQETDEEIILLIRRHFITNAPWIASGILLAAAPLFVIPYLSYFVPQLNLSFLVQSLIITFYYLLVFGLAFIQFLTWYFNVCLVTNIRVVDIHISGILYKNISEAKLDLIQDVSYTQIGGLRNIFNYGDILIQTAGSLENFEFDKASNPAQIIQILERLTG